MSINAMSEQEGKQRAAEGLSQVLADTLTLCLKTQNFHWNVTGPMFPTLHRMFEDQYNELWRASDVIAERIRTLGFRAPGTYREFVKLSHIREHDGVPRAAEIIEELIGDHETAARAASQALWHARSTVDAPTEDLLTQRLSVHEKAAWMLRSSLSEEESPTVTSRDNDLSEFVPLRSVDSLEQSQVSS